MQGSLRAFAVRAAGTVSALRRATLPPIIEAMDEDIDATQCRGDGSCLGGAACLTHHLWEDLNRTTRKFLEGVTLAGMVEAHAARHGKQVVSAVIPVRKHA